MQRYDVAIIGSGPAGLSAAVNLKIRNKSFLLFGSAALSRKIEAAPRVDNYLGLPQVSGRELRERFEQHLRVMGIDVLPEKVQMVYPMGDYFSLASSKQAYEANMVILAPGVFQSRLLGGEEEFLGRGVSYCATCDAPLYRGKTIAVLAYTDEAAGEAKFLSEIAGKTYYVPMKNAVAMPQAGVEILAGEATGVDGEERVHTLLFGEQRVEVDGVFIIRDSLTPSSLLPGLPMRDGYIEVDINMSTGIPGCYAAGDCTGKPHQYLRAAGQGQAAALNVAAELDRKKAK